MTPNDRLDDLLRDAFPPLAGDPPARDLWPAIRRRMDEPRRWSWFDVGLAAAAALALLVFPESLVVLAYHF